MDSALRELVERLGWYWRLWVVLAICGLSIVAHEIWPSTPTSTCAATPLDTGGDRG